MDRAPAYGADNLGSTPSEGTHAVVAQLKERVPGTNEVLGLTPNSGPILPPPVDRDLAVLTPMCGSDSRRGHPMHSS